MMGIYLNNAVSNQKNTPAIQTGNIADRPLANNTAEGTIYVAVDTQEIYSAQAGSWILVTTGGGGGSQNLDQVLAVGNTATNKDINLYYPNANNFCQINVIGFLSQITNIAFTKFVGALKSGSFVMQYQNIPATRSLQYEAIINENSNIVRILAQNSTGVFNAANRRELRYEADATKNIFKVISQITNNDFRSFEVNASYSGGNTVELLEQDILADTLASVECLAENQTARITLKSTPFYSLSVYDNLVLKHNEISFSNTNNASISINPSFPATGIITINLPEYDGKIANVNERIIDNNVDLSAGNYPCAAYGVYVVNVGDNTNTFDLDTFVSNGADGQFVTICANDTPVKCTNTAGNFIGSPNINSKGLYKLMKFGNDIYSSHI